MNHLRIKGEKGTFFTPNIDFNPNSGQLKITGESYLEDTAEFYEPILDWLKAFIAESPESIEVKIKLSYFNTSSSKYLSFILSLLKEYENQGGDLTVVWYHILDDEDMVEEIEDFTEDTGVDIIMYPVRSEADLEPNA